MTEWWNGGTVYKRILISAKLQNGKRSQKTERTGRSALRGRRSALDCSAIEEEVEEEGEKVVVVVVVVVEEEEEGGGGGGGEEGKGVRGGEGKEGGGGGGGK